MDTEITNGAEGAEAAAGTLLTDQPGNQGSNETNNEGGKPEPVQNEADKGKDGADAESPTSRNRSN